MDVVYYRQTQFNQALAKMARSGGVPQQAARRVKEIVGALNLGATGISELGKLTKHGENRIKHCIKLDLPGAHRLVCLHQGDVFTLLFVGSHEECDRWLDQNRGLTLIVDRQSQRITVVSEVRVDDPLPSRTLNLDAGLDRRLLDTLPAEYVELLPVGRADLLTFSRLTATIGDDDLLEYANTVSGPEEQHLILNILMALRDGNVDGAKALLDKQRRRAVSADDDPMLLGEAVRAEANADALVNLRELSEIEIDHLFNRASFREWLTFLHPDQKRLVGASFDGPAAMAGVSGSGKTSVLVHRAKHLATLYPSDRILVLTLNHALSALIGSLVQELCAPSVLARIDAWSIDELCRKIVNHFDPNRHLLTEDPRSREDLEDCWDDSFAWQEQQDTLEPILKSLRGTHEIDAVRYIRDEFIWVRSGLTASPVEGSVLDGRAEYLSADKTPREGRSIPFTADWRGRILEGLNHYEGWLESGGFVDPAALSQEAHRHLGLLKASNHPFQYRAVLVDEAQDLGNVELELIRALAPTKPDSLLLSGDSNQQVFPKSHSLTAAGIRVAPTDRRYLRKNYRNTKQILEAGLRLLEGFGRSDLLSDSEARALSPELSVREGPRPLVVAAKDRQQEQAFVARFVKEQLRQRPHAPVGIVACGVREDSPKLLASLQRQLQECGLTVQLLNQDSGLLLGGVYVSAMETVKGFEFGLVVIMRCSEGMMPDRETPPEEQWREARRLYVAMTRGRDEVLITHAGPPSKYVVGMGTFVQHSTVTDQRLAP
jgi:superfamily I DNA/RNA helicase